MAGAIQPDFQIVAGRGAAHFLSEERFYLAAGMSGMIGDFQQRKRLRKIAFHELDDRENLGVLHTEARAQRKALAIVSAADPVGQCLFANAVDEVLAEILADQVQHHVQRSRAARAGIDVAVDFVEIGIDLGLRECLGKAGQVFPVDRAALAVEQAGLCQHMGAGAQTADSDAAVVNLAQPGGNRLVVEFFHIDAGTDDCHVRPTLAGEMAALVGERGVHLDADAGRGRDLLTVNRSQPPDIGGVAQHAIGDAQRFDGRGKRKHGEVWYEEEDDGTLLCMGLVHDRCSHGEV